MSESMGDFWIRKIGEFKERGGKCAVCKAEAALRAETPALREGLPYRSECDCSCHTPEGREVGMMHFAACCEPDPPHAAGEPEQAK
jgi:hypothetical protein